MTLKLAFTFIHLLLGKQFPPPCRSADGCVSVCGAETGYLAQTRIGVSLSGPAAASPAK